MNFFESQSDLNILLIRAGSTELDEQGRITGSLDMPLSPTGQQEARTTAAEIGARKIDAIYSASCLAARETAEVISQAVNVKVRVKDTWTNLDHGLWHGKSLEELKETQPKLFRQWNENPESVCPPGGETVEAVRERIIASIKKLRRKWKSGTVAIVAPDPLYSIIRSVIESSELRDLFSNKENMLRWEALAMAAAV